MEKTTVQQLTVECSWIVTVSDKGVTVSLSRKAMESCRKTIHTYVMRVLPWVLASLATYGGTAGVMNWLRQQPETPAISPTEEVAPHR